MKFWKFLSKWITFFVLAIVSAGSLVSNDNSEFNQPGTEKEHRS